MTQLGLFYRDGQGVKQDYVEAIKWFRKATEHHTFSNTTPEPAAKDPLVAWSRGPLAEAVASCALAYMYAEGLGVKQDWADAFFWGTLRGNYFAIRAQAAKHLTQQQVEAVQKKVDSWNQAALTGR